LIQVLKAGDEVAVYDGNLCVGAVIVDGEWPLEMNAWEADSVSQGFITGNNITVRIWDNQTNLEYESDITFEIGNGSFGDGVFSRINIDGTNIVSVPNNGISLPTKFSLSQNYPNPFNPSTKIKYSIPHSSKVVIKLFDILGNEIETLVNEEKPAGEYRFQLNAASLSSGVYFYRIQAGSFVETRKMVLMK